MTPKDFTELWETMCKAEAEILGTKGIEYTKAGEDRLINFKEIGSGIDVDPRKVWLIYFMKHIYAIITYIKKGYTYSDETIEGRFHDARNYLALGLALIKDLEIKKSQ